MKGADLKELRKSSGLKSTELAEALGISPSTLSRYENGKAEMPVAIGLAARYLCEPQAMAQKPVSERLVDAIREAVNA